jgi:hypothetical protein
MRFMKRRKLRRVGGWLLPGIWLAAFALAAFPGATVAQFTDTFNTIDPAWVPNRYPPAGFASVVFDGDSRLQLTIDQTGSTANRPALFSSTFYATQGCERPGGITGVWTLSAQVFVSSAFNTTTGPLVRSDLWANTGTTGADGNGDYMILGFTNASPSDAFNPSAADRAFRFQAWDGNTGNWISLGLPAGFAFDAWHTLSETSTGSTFEFRIDGVLVFTNTTVAGSDLLSAMVQGYNFDQAGSYSVYWDNVIAGVAPIIANSPLTAAGTVWRRARRRAMPPARFQPALCSTRRPVPSPGPPRRLEPRRCSLAPRVSPA